MTIRKLEAAEHALTRPLYEEVFHEDGKAFVDYYYSEKTRDNIIYVIEEDGDIQAMFHLNPYTLIVNGDEKQCHYIVAVATRKEYRGKRFMASLMKQALQDMYRAGETFTYLMPAAEAIYLPHDFRTVYEQEISYYDPEQFDDCQKVISTASEKECEELAEWSEKDKKSKYQVYTRCDAAYYERLQKELACEQGQLVLARENGQITDAMLWFPEDSAEETEEKPKIMVRIVDVRRMLMSLKLYRFINICFQVTDPILTENNRVLFLTGTEFSGVMLMDGKRENSEGSISIAALTELIFGAKTVDEICTEVDVVMSEHMKEELKKLIPLKCICINETV